MTHGKHRHLYLLVAVLVWAADQFSKWLVASRLAASDVRTVVPGFFNLAHLYNRGAAFGLFADLGSPLGTVFLVGVSVTALTVVFLLLWRNPGERASRFSLALILGGALGNLFDRVRAGGVVDFLDFHLGRYHWPAFNLADGAIVLGAASLIYHVLRRPGPRRQEL